jgi:23S rRNA (guanosine2251-2'-O)-methyltransferase
MLKDYNKDKFLSFKLSKQLKIILDLAYFIEQDKCNLESKHFKKIEKYHDYLVNNSDSNSEMVTKEFSKIKGSLKQFQVYLTFLERIVGKSTAEYDFLIDEGDKEESKKFPISVLIDGVRSIHNIGAIIRNCDCFGVSRIYIKDLGVELDTEKIAKTAMGADKYCEISYVKDSSEVIKSYKDHRALIIALDTGKIAKTFNEIKINKEIETLLIIGHEQFGIDHKLLKQADYIIKIPMFGKKNSLNVSVAAGIALEKLSAVYNS